MENRTQQNLSALIYYFTWIQMTQVKGKYLTWEKPEEKESCT